MPTETVAPMIIRLLPFNAEAKPMFVSTEPRDIAVAFGLTNPVQKRIATKKTENTVSDKVVVAAKAKNKMLNINVKLPAI